MRLKKWVREFQSKCLNKGLSPCIKALQYLNTKKSLKEAWDHCVEPGWIDWLLNATKSANVHDHRLKTERYHVSDMKGMWHTIPAQYNAYGKVYFTWAYETQNVSLKLRRSVCNLMRAVVSFPGSP